MATRPSAEGLLEGLKRFGLGQGPPGRARVSQPVEGDPTAPTPVQGAQGRRPRGDAGVPDDGEAARKATSPKRALEWPPLYRLKTTEDLRSKPFDPEDYLKGDRADVGG